MKGFLTVLTIVVLALSFGHRLSGLKIAGLRCLVQHLSPRMPRSNELAFVDNELYLIMGLNQIGHVPKLT